LAPEPSPQIALEPSPAVPGAAATEGRPIQAIGPWRAVWRRLRRNRIAMASLAVFVAIVACCVAAPLWADQVAHVGPDENNLTGTFERGGKRLYVVTPPPETHPVGPGWSGRYLLGADKNGRDEMVRLLYGGRNSLFVGFVSALITTVIAVILGLAGGYFRGRTDLIVRTTFDVIWSFPVLLLAIALGTALAVGGLHLGPVDIEGGSLWIPILVIGIIYIPYLGRPSRGQVLSLREKEFVEAARSLGASDARIIFRHILPNLVAPIIVYTTLLIPTNILFEAALSFLGVGVQPPTASWGAMIADAIAIFDTAWWYMTFPGVALLLTVLAFNLIGDGLQDALNPRTGR